MLDRIRPRVGATLEPVYKEIIKLFSDRAIANRGVTKANKSYEEIYDSFMTSMGGAHITDISDTTRKQVLNVIRDNQDKGVAAISKAITERMSPRFTRARASTIARTETHSAASFSTHEQYKAFNEPTMMKRWAANNDDRTRPSHYAVSGIEIGIDDTFSVAGKLMKYTGDPSGGAAEVINCRCVTIYFESDDVFVDGETDKPAPDVPIQDTLLTRRATSDTVKVISRAKAIKILEKKFKEANEDPRYPKGSKRFKGSTNEYGNINGIIRNQGTDETLSSIVVIMEELDDLADIMNVPRLRGITSIRRTRKAPIANMGDGVMGINIDYFNKWSAGVNKPKPDIDAMDVLAKEYKKKRDDLYDEMDKIIKDTRANIAISKNPVYADNMSPEVKKRYDELRVELSKIQTEFKELGNALAVRSMDVSEWKYGDKLKDRPHNGFEYYDEGYERLRNTMLHEFGHQVHQQFKVNGDISSYYLPKVEGSLGVVQGGRDIRASGGSTLYADTNAKEWWAENFALWADNKLDLVDPRFTASIKKVINDQEPDDIF